MRKLAHYYYDEGVELQVFAEQRRIFVRDQHDNVPLTKAHVTGGTPMPLPDEGTEMADWSYEALGLYFSYGMTDTGWSGDC